MNGSIKRRAERLDGSSKNLDFSPISTERNVPVEFLPRDYGAEHEFIALPLGFIIMMNQIRHSRNEQQTNLGISIEEGGMQSFPTVARLNEDEFIKYSMVVNYRSNEDLDIHRLLADSPKFDGYYYVLIAGHSRIGAIIRNEESRKENALASGFITNPMMDSTVKMIVVDHPSPAEMIIRQISENIHSRPASEHIAADVLSLHRYLKEEEGSITDKDFLRLFGDKLPDSMFDTIMNFGNLPIDIQKLNFEDVRFPFTVAAKIGSLAEPKMNLERFKLCDGKKPTKKQQAKLDELVSAYLAAEYHEIGRAIYTNKKFGVNLQIKRLENERKLLVDSLNNDGNTLFGTTLEDWGMDTEQIIEQAIKGLRKRSRDAIAAIIEHPVGQVMDVADRYAELLAYDGNPTSLRAQRNQAERAIKVNLGSIGVGGAVDIDK